MTMEGVGRSELRKLQKEQERERRRLRDRQRRQSMSVEEREKHLARRRRNYQLRRLRAGIGIGTGTGIASPQSQQEQEQEQPTPSTDPITAQCNNHFLAFESLQAITNSQSLEVPVHKLAQFSGQLRLSHVKNLARSLNGHVGESHVMIKANEVSTDKMAKGLRLNRVKNLARSLNSAVKGSSNQTTPDG